ncbi:MAG: serine/threonine-protein kinase, partial [Anaerolineae bacterium]
MNDLTGTTLGQYEIIQKIGQGGMAHVFKAYQRALDRFVAIKVLSPTLAEEPGFTERFHREAQAVARLHHPNILQVFDFGIHDKYSYIVMRYVENSTTLDELIHNGTPLERLIDYIVQVADALHYAHEQDIVHRDVKPSNILIDGKWALLSDFGLVKMGQSSSHLTQTGTGLGTPAYMAPEQASGLKVDRRADIYALGIILHRILTGTVPHDAPTPFAILVKRSTEPVPPLRQMKPDIPESVEHVVLRSLAKEPDARYSTATDFAQALAKAKSDPGYREPTLANPPDTTMATMPKT